MKGVLYFITLLTIIYYNLILVNTTNLLSDSNYSVYIAINDFKDNFNNNTKITLNITNIDLDLYQSFKTNSFVIKIDNFIKQIQNLHHHNNNTKDIKDNYGTMSIKINKDYYHVTICVKKSIGNNLLN